MALTLGIGTAVATPAWAEPSNPDSSSSASESPQKPSPRRGGAAESSGPTSDPRNDAGQSDTGSDTAADTSSEDGDREVNEAELVEDEKPTVAGSADEPTELVADEINETSPASIVDSDSSTSASAPSSADTAKVTASLDPSTADDVVAERPADHPHQKAAVVSDGLAGDQAATASYALTAIPPSDTPAPSPLIRQPSSPVGVLLGGPVALLEIAGKALNMLFNPDPTAPGDSPLLLGVLAFVRREIQRTFFNSSPNAAADVASTSEGIGTRISVLDNDTDPNPGDVLTITDYTQAANGVVTLNADGSFAYTPEDGFSGTDTFTYTVSDEASGWHGHFAGLLQRHTSTATVSITVKPAPVNESPTAADDSATTAEDTPVLIDAAANDSDPDGDDITILNVGTAQHGTVAVLDGRITYTPGLNFHGTDSFDYTITDGSLSDTATVTITVTPANDAPVANVDTATVAGNSVANVIDVLANDTDVDTADTLSVAVVGVPTRGGTVAINDGNTLSYTPAAGFSGTETFTYAVSDGTATSVGTVTVVVSPMIPVNQAPIAVDDAATTSANTPIVITPLANDTDPDGDTLTLTTVSDTLNGGTVTINGTTLTYTPATNHTGSDTFSYTVTDGKITDTATVTITINPGSLITPVGTVTTLDAAGVQSILGITHSPEGTLLITAKDSNGEAFLGTVDADGSVVRLAELSGLPYGVAVGPGGRIYVTDGETGAITSFDPAEGYTSEIVATLVDGPCPHVVDTGFVVMRLRAA
ncbi:Ig-like domain-containing protein [Mycolicibacterium gilvum]|uniref:Ig-like domain-containing protein n=1 Tax=Mycolicibacterium gilvum TaxID=1804 RepID=UPI00404573FD